MIILGIETSCDETAAAVVEISAYGKPSADKGVTILSNVVASSAKLQAKYGGVIPEQAAREQIKSIIPVIEEVLRLASLAQGKQSLDAIAVTYGPGLIGSLLVGVETAKTLATVWDKPLIPVNHLIGHFYANWITDHLPGVKAHLEGGLPSFPTIGLLVSGGHTDLLLFKDHGKYEYLGGTRDDAAGECFDKCARLLGLPYPGGPAIAQSAMQCKVQSAKCKIKLPRPMINSKNFDFSFSGLKTAVANLMTKKLEDQTSNIKPQNPASNLQHPTSNNITNLAASIEAAIVDVLVAKTIRAAQTHKVGQIMIAGGVAANQELIRNLKFKIKNLKLKAQLFAPPPELCTDNAAMIAAAAFFNYKPIAPLSLQANPGISLS